MNDKVELKPCPFCGGEAVYEEMMVRKGYECNVHCNSCLASMHSITFDWQFEATEEAITAWNKRA